MHLLGADVTRRGHWALNALCAARPLGADAVRHASVKTEYEGNHTAWGLRVSGSTAWCSPLGSFKVAEIWTNRVT